MRRAPIAAIGCALVLLLGACADLQWINAATGSRDGVSDALAECHHLAEREAFRRAPLSWPHFDAYHRVPHRSRHHPRHVHRFHHHQQTHRVLDLADFCMRSKGFVLVEVEVEEAAKAPTPPGSN